MSDATGLTELGPERGVARGKTLFQMGTPCDMVYMVEEGAIALYRGETLLAVAGKGCFLGAAAALLDEPHIYSAKGAESLSLVKPYKSHDLKNAFTANADLAASLAKGMDAELLALENGAGEGEKNPTNKIALIRRFMRGRAERIAAVVKSPS